MDTTSIVNFDNSEVLNSCGEILKNLQARERALESILEHLHLNLSDFGEAVRRKTEDASETLMNQGISEVNKENIILSHINKTLKNDENLQIYTKLVLQKAEIENEHIVSREWNSIYYKAIKTYEQGIQKVTEELNQNVGPAVLSPENKLSSASNYQQRDLQRKVSTLCEKLYEQKKTANQLDEELSAFEGLPTDIESASHEVYLKKRELEQICERMEELMNSTDYFG
uniref:Uncharacterized protein n=1 Tax=Lygus hesperus TaxID=30085 RepID=A0A0A9X262_LYGHE